MRISLLCLFVVLVGALAVASEADAHIDEDKAGLSLEQGQSPGLHQFDTAFGGDDDNFATSDGAGDDTTTQLLSMDPFVMPRVDIILPPSPSPRLASKLVSSRSRHFCCEVIPRRGDGQR